MEFFSRKYGTFSQQIAIASLQNAFTNTAKSTRHFVVQAVGTCALVFFYITRAMIGKKYNQSQLGKEKSTLLRFI